MTEVKLGNKVIDTVTGFTGIATSRTEFMNGCKQIAITGKVTASGEVRAVDTDEEQIKYVGRGVAKDTPKKKDGGPSRYRTVTRIC